jgi:hypothetical protein
VLGLTNMPSFVTVPLERRAQYTLDSFGFVGNIMTDPTGIVVREGGPFKDLPGPDQTGAGGAGGDHRLDLRHRHR